jgi:hypothetical protein
MGKVDTRLKRRVSIAQDPSGQARAHGVPPHSHVLRRIAATGRLLMRAMRRLPVAVR